jgi:hypothetical protein
MELHPKNVINELMLILEKFRNKYHQICIMVDREKRDAKFDCRLKGESKLFFIRTDLAPPLHWRRVYSSDGPGRRVVLVDLISSGNDSGNNSGDNSGNNSCDNSEDHEASSETITHEICPWTFTSSLINCSNASISICCRKLLHMTLTGFGLKSTSSRNRLKRSRQVLKPVRAKIAFL